MRLRERAWHIALALPFVFVVATSPWVESRWRAATLLLRFSGVEGRAASLGAYAVREEALTLHDGQRELRARLFLPEGASDPPGLVMVHGIHRLGVDEPRLMKFARALSSAGVAVLTPHVESLADYRVEPAAVDTLAASGAWLAQRTGRARVGFMGLSFAGGLSLMLAAKRPDDVAFAVSVGGHHDLSRVLRFLVTNEVETPDGQERLTAHGYGLLVFAYGHASRLFPTDPDRSRALLRRWLHGDPEGAKRDVSSLEPRARATMELLVRQDHEALAGAVKDILASEAVESLAASPRGKLGTMVPPVFLLHGATDDVIPASEARWIWSELPPGARGALLVSRALGHVELKGEPTAGDRLALVELMSGVLRAAWDEPHDDGATRR